MSLDEKKQRKYLELLREANHSCRKPVKVNGKDFDSTLESKVSLLQTIVLALAGNHLPTVWYDTNGNSIIVDNINDLVSILYKLETQTQTSYEMVKTKKDNIDASNTPEELDAIILRG